MKKLIMYSDGGARGNPGPAGIGVVIYNDTHGTVAEISQYIGETTNNQAEYQAIYVGLQKCKELHATHVACFMDSQLAVKQLNREYRIKNQGLAVWIVKIWSLIQEFQRVTFAHVVREKNKVADRLVNEAIDKQE